MKKYFLAAAAAMMVAGMATAQTVSVIGLDGNTIATYSLDQIDQIVFTPAETPDIPVDPNVPEGAILCELQAGHQYEGATYDVDYDTVMEELEVPSLSDTYVELYAKQGEEWSDNYTANAPGFWFDRDGNICSWGAEGCCVYIEYSDGVFYYGQFPGCLEVGDNVTITVALMANDITIPYTFYFKCVEAEVVAGDVVYEYKAEGTAPQNSEYVATAIDFDAAEIAAALNVETLAEAQFILLNADGAYVNIYSANAGYWVNAEGENVGWGDEASIFIEYRPDENESALFVGNMPDCELGTSNAIVGFYANSKIALIEVKFTITEPEEAPAEE